jgi:hypothetical protein
MNLKRKIQIYLLGRKYRKPEINNRLRNDGSLNYQSNCINNAKIRFSGLDTDGEFIYFQELKNERK